MNHVRECPLFDEDHATGTGRCGMQPVTFVAHHEDGVKSSGPNLILAHFAKAIDWMSGLEPGNMIKNVAMQRSVIVQY
jgi:hypothetical protein